MPVARLLRLCEEQLPIEQTIGVVAEVENPEDKLWRPQSIPQQMCFESNADRLLYGGEPGGGKTAMLLIAATLLQRRTIIFRRNYTRLKGLISTSVELLQGMARYNGQDKVWRDIPGDRQIEFGAVEHEKQMHGYQGQPHDGIFFDEITEFPEKYFRFLTGWNRSPIEGQRCRIICTCNPPVSREGKWIEDYWAPWLKKSHPNPAQPGELRWFVSYSQVDPLTGEKKEIDKEVDGPEPIEIPGRNKKIRPHSRTFIRAKLSDNQFINTEDYEAVLQGLPPGIREILMDSDFDVNFEIARPNQLFQAEWIKAAMARWKPLPDSLTYREVVATDVSRDGDDRICIMSRLGLWFSQIRVYSGTEGNNGDAVKDMIMKEHHSTDTQYRIDMVGWGASAYDSMMRLGTLDVVGMNGGKKSLGYWTNYYLDMTRHREMHGTEIGRPGWAKRKAYKRDRRGTVVFENKRAEWAWGLMELLDPSNGFNIAIPPDDELLDELVAHDWKAEPVDDPQNLPGVAFKVKIEKKENVKKRLDGKSPDKADTLMMAAAEIHEWEY